MNTHAFLQLIPPPSPPAASPAAAAAAAKEPSATVPDVARESELTVNNTCPKAPALLVFDNKSIRHACGQSSRAHPGTGQDEGWTDAGV